jgi:dTMP kinase
VVPALAKGHWVISDRYTLSSLIYQSLTAPEEEAGLAWVRELNRNALRPDLVIVLDVSPEIAEGRRRARGGAEELFDRRELQAKLASAYLNAARYSTENLLHVDGAASMNAVAEQVILGVSQKFLR